MAQGDDQIYDDAVLGPKFQNALNRYNVNNDLDFGYGLDEAEPSFNWRQPAK